MAKPPRTKNLRLEDVADPERLTRSLNQFLEPAHAALTAGLTFSENIQSQYHVSNPVYVPDDWISMSPLGSGWRDRGAEDAAYNTFGPAQYRKSMDGEWVMLRGILQQTAGSSPAFLFPASHAPVVYMACATQGNSAFANFDVATTGTMTLTVGSASSNVLLSGIRFPAADRTPPVPPCFPYDFAYTLGPSAPRYVFLTRIQEESAGSAPRAFSVSVLDWEVVYKAGSPYVRVRNIPGLIPGRSYRFELLVVAS
jgi:hypothetical protein